MAKPGDKARWHLRRAQALRIGETLRATRQGLGITMTAAASAAQISRVTWHRLEKGEATVALGAWLAAARVLDMELALLAAGTAEAWALRQPADEALPLRIRLADYPQLRQLAWQVGDASQVLTPREALGLYERNWRHLQQAGLAPQERALLSALRQVFGAELPGV